TNAAPASGKDDASPNFPIGLCLEVGAVENCFGDSIALVERRAFTEVGAFPAINDDIPGFWQFLATAAVAGCPLEVVPHPLFRIVEPRPSTLNMADFIKSSRATLE